MQLKVRTSIISTKDKFSEDLLVDPRMVSTFFFGRCFTILLNKIQYKKFSVRILKFIRNEKKKIRTF